MPAHVHENAHAHAHVRAHNEARALTLSLSPSTPFLADKAEDVGETLNDAFNGWGKDKLGKPSYRPPRLHLT